MNSAITFKRLCVLFITISSPLLIRFVKAHLEEAIPSGGIKSEIGSCHKKKGPNGVNQEFCYINNKQYSEVEEYFKNEQEKSGKGCKKFKLSDFNEKSPSIMYGEASGRFGNQLLGYAMLYQIGKQLGVSTFMDYDMKEQLTTFYTSESINMPILYDKYCNPEDIPWEMWCGPLADLLTNEKLRTGRFLWLYKQTDDVTCRDGYKPEDHLGPEQEEFSKAYIRHLRNNLKFHPRVQTRVNLALKDVAKRMKKKPKDLTYIGVHNRRTDHLHFVQNTLKLDDAEELGKDFFEDGMEYFREEYDNVAFIYASDDMEWGYKNLNGINDLYLLGAGQNLDEKNQKEVVDQDAAAYDFALLVSCNHTIVTRGTYTMWIAMLAGGEYYTEYGPILGPDAILEGKSK